MMRRGNVRVVMAVDIENEKRRTTTRRKQK